MGVTQSLRAQLGELEAEVADHRGDVTRKAETLSSMAAEVARLRRSSQVAAEKETECARLAGEVAVLTEERKRLVALMAVGFAGSSEPSTVSPARITNDTSPMVGSRCLAMAQRP